MTVSGVREGRPAPLGARVGGFLRRLAGGLFRRLAGAGVRRRLVTWWGPRAARARLSLDRSLGAVRPAGRTRVLATACWQFPIYSQTFVYEELRQMLESGFDVRLLYGELAGPDQLPASFRGLWRRKRRTFLDPEAAQRDLDYYRRRMPGKVEDLIALVRQASGRTRESLLADAHFRMAFAYTRLVEAYRPSWLHSYFFYEGTLFTLVASYLLGIPRGVSCYADHMLDDFALKLVPLHLATCDVVVATSRRIMLELNAMHPMPERRNVIVKPNAIDSSRFPASVRREPGAREPFHLVCVSRLEPKKGLIDLVDAVRLVLDRGVVVELHLIGATDDPSPDARHYTVALRERIAALRLEDHVRLEGRRSMEDVVRFLSTSHVFTAPFVELDSGDKDGIPTAMLEAMSTGIAVLTTDAGSIREPIQDGVNGVVVEQRNPRALADALVSLLEDPGLRQRLGAQATSTVHQRYDVRHCDFQLHDRMRRVIASRRAVRQLTGSGISRETA